MIIYNYEAVTIFPYLRCKVDLVEGKILVFPYFYDPVTVCVVRSVDVPVQRGGFILQQVKMYFDTELWGMFWAPMNGD